MILQRFIRGKHTFALVFEGKVIGSLGVEEYNEAHYPEWEKLQGREIGYALSKEYWGRGLMPEAVQSVIAYLFRQEKLDFIIVGHFERNAQSRRVIEKCGFRYVKTCPYQTQRGNTESSREYVLFREEWENTKKPQK